MGFDFGALQPYVDDHLITDIDTNGHSIYINHIEKGVFCVGKIMHKDMEMLLNRLVNSKIINDQFNYENPILDGVIEGLRIHATHPSFSTTGYTLRIRKNPLPLVIDEQMIQKRRYCHPAVLHFLKACMKAKMSVIFGGEVGTGKTQLMKTALSFCDPKANIVLISDIDEMRLLELYPTRNITQYIINDIMDYRATTACILRDNADYVCFQEVRDHAVDDLFKVLSSSARVCASVHLKSSLLMPQRLIQLSDNKNDQHLLSTIHDYIQVCIMPVKEIVQGVTHRFIGEIALFYNDENQVSQKHLIYQQRLSKVYFYALPKFYEDFFKCQNIRIDWREGFEAI